MEAIPLANHSISQNSASNLRTYHILSFCVPSSASRAIVLVLKANLSVAWNSTQEPSATIDTPRCRWSTLFSALVWFLGSAVDGHSACVSSRIAQTPREDPILL